MTNYPETIEVGKVKSEQILEKIKIFGPISCIELEKYFEVKKNIVQSCVFRLRRKGNTIRSFYVGKVHHYDFVEPEKPTEPQKLLTEKSEVIKEEKKPEKVRGTDCFVDRCYYLIKALEHCSNSSIMDNFNLSNEEARVLINKVATKYRDVSVSFSAHIKKG